MISNIDSNYNAICKLFSFSKESTSDINKKILLEMAKNGKEKPNIKTKLGSALFSYTNKLRGCYDPVFDKQIRKLRPDWFVTQFDKANENKKLLLKMAKNGEERPNTRTKLGIVLYNYTNKSCSSYNAVFYKQIRKIRPDWFIMPSDKANENKKLLLKMAKNGENKPHYKTKLGMVLYNYTQKLGGCYDPVFDKQIRKLRPDWFISMIEKTNQNIKLLLKMAKNGENKPHHRAKLGRTLYVYTHKSSGSYRPLFDKQIRKLRPDWFKK